MRRYEEMTEMLAEKSVARLGKAVSLWILKPKEPEIRCHERPIASGKPIQK